MKRTIIVGLVATFLLVLSAPARVHAGCTTSAAEVCCPAACAAKKGRAWTKADAILRSCLASMQCSASDVATATVFTKCDCR